MEVNKISFSIGIFIPPMDEEHQQIARRLRMYGITPSGNKNADKAKLHEIELREAKKEDCVSNKFLTVTKEEQEKIQEKKKEKRKEINPEKYPDSSKAIEILAQQNFLAIKMKNKKEPS